MKTRYLVILPALAALLYPLTVYANSSWVWLTQTTPLTVLPFAIIGTLAIEILSVIFVIKPAKRLKAAIIITLANVFSFAAGYFLGAIDLEVGYTIMDVIMHTPHYIISIIYLLLTLIIEMPVVGCSLWRDTTNKNLFIALIVASNIVTSILVSVCEGIFAPGSYW